VTRIDLGDIDTVKGSNEGFDVELYHPATNADTGIIITVLGKDSDAFQKTNKQQQKKRMDRLSKNGFRGGKVAPPSQEEMDADSLELLASCTVGWKTIIDESSGSETILLDGEELSFSLVNAKKVYKRFPWIKEQIDTAIGDRANFIKA